MMIGMGMEVETFGDVFPSCNGLFLPVASVRPPLLVIASN